MCQLAREQRGLTTTAVGERLLLSPRQVRALEEVDLSAFHNSRFYAAGLRKYAAFAGVDAAPLERVMPVARPVEHESTVVVAQRPPVLDAVGRGGLAMAAMAAVAVAVAVAAGGGYVWWQRAIDRPATAAQVPITAPARTLTPAVAPAAVLSEPAAEPAVAEPTAMVPDVSAGALSASAPPPADVLAPFGEVRVPTATWIFLRYIDNTVVERPVAGGERTVFEKPPVYLAVGTPDAELTLGSERVNTAPYIVNGQLRLRASDFNALTGPPEPVTAIPVDGVR